MVRDYDMIGWDQLHALVEASIGAEHLILINKIERLVKQSDNEDAIDTAYAIIDLIKARGFTQSWDK